MSHFAKVVNGVVEQVIVAEQDFIDRLPPERNTVWVQTSYNTREGKYVNPKNGEEMPGTPMRKNFAGKGYTYDEARDEFIPPKPFRAWVRDMDKGTWKPPRPIPRDGKLYDWDDDADDWRVVLENPIIGRI
jgi:hypothetical protein